MDIHTSPIAMSITQVHCDGYDIAEPSSVRSQDQRGRDALLGIPAMLHLLRAASGRVSRVPPVQTAVRNCMRDGGRPSGFGDQELIPSYRKLLWSKAMVVLS